MNIPKNIPNNSALVSVNEGVLDGEVVDNEYGGTFFSFKGIPYAAPPIGYLRFKAPQPPKPWEGIRSAKDFGPTCYQYDYFTQQVPSNSSEDCLYLNVYTPDLMPVEPLPVMVFIHGGGFVSGSGNDDMYGPEFLVRHDLILVTFNYRLEALGFLCLDTEEIPGNAGMKDQVAALKWVKHNIEIFGGDPDNVTIFGESSGGASVAFHLVSPMSKGLFKRAIAQSGTANCWWPLAFEPRERALVLARKLGLDTEDDTKLADFFKTQPLESLIQLQLPITANEKVKGMLGFFGVVSEKKYGDNESFFYGDIHDVIRNGIHDDVEVIIGYNEDEGIQALSLGLPKILENLNIFLTPKPIEINCRLREQLEVSRKIMKYYFKDVTPSTQHWKIFAKLFSFDMYNFAIVQWAKHCSIKNKTYFYNFSCKSERNVYAKFFGLDNFIDGNAVVCHGDDLAYLFPEVKLLKEKVNQDSETFQLIKDVTKLWTNFAKYGDPTPDDSLNVKWLPYTIEKQEYLDIGDILAAGVGLDKDDVEFWESIYRTYFPKHVYNGIS